MNLYVIDNEWRRNTLTWDDLELNLDGLTELAVVDYLNQTDAVSKTYGVDVTNEVQAALASGKTEISFGLAITTQANNNQHNIFSISTTRSDVLKPTLAGKVVSITDVKSVQAETAQGRVPELPGTDILAMATVTVKSDIQSNIKTYPILTDIYVQSGDHKDIAPGDYGPPKYNSALLRVKNSDSNQAYTRRIYTNYNISEVEGEYDKAVLEFHIEKSETTWGGTDLYVLEDPNFQKETITWNNAPSHEETKLRTFTPADDSSLWPSLKTYNLDIEEVSVVEIETEIGTVPRLPETVLVYRPNGEAREEAVTWD